MKKGQFLVIKTIKISNLDFFPDPWMFVRDKIHFPDHLEMIIFIFVVIFTLFSIWSSINQRENGKWEVPY